MRIQTMASQGGGGGQQPQFQTLARQGSLYSLTLNEVQNQLSEPLHSMNLDELLRNVLPTEGDQPLALDLENASPQFASGLGLHHQGSVTLTRALSKKTVDEVWRDIQQGQNKINDELKSAHESQLTLGEMTLEDFLVKAGIVPESPDKKINDNMIGNVDPVGGTNPVVGGQGYPQGVHWLQQYHQVPSLQQQKQPLPQQQPPPQQAQQNVVAVYAPSQPVPQPLGIGVGNILDGGYPDSQMTISSPMMGVLSDTQTSGRKRVAPGDVVEKTVERRQKRMIKNRESAARSRARKQAYTNELENKISRLEEENERLKKQKELEKILYNVPPPEPKFQLRRTSSAPF